MASRCDEMGFELVGIGDSPLVFRETFTTLGWLSQHVRRARLASIVTNVETRDPTVLASAAATLDELTGGRAVLGIGTGDSAVAIVRRTATKLEALEAAVQRIRDLGAAESSAGMAVRVSWSQRAVPIFMSAEGPRSVALAGRIADGVFVGRGLDDASVKSTLCQLAESKTHRPEELGDPEIWFFARVAVAASRQDGIRALGAGLAASANRALRHAHLASLPEPLKRKVSRLRSSYDVGRHLDASHDSPNALLASDPELADYLADRFAIVGTAAECAARVRQLEELGVDRLCLTLATEDPEETLRAWTDEVLPSLSRATSPGSAT